VICPYVGPRPAFDLALRDGDELLVEDDNPGRSSYAARDRAARRASGEWLVFLDADCTPDPALLDAYFASPVPADVAVLAGGIEDAVVEDSAVARYVAARAKMAQPAGYAQTANCAVRREAFLAVGGWPEPIVSGGDADLCWRLRDAGWKLESRPGAVVRHRSRATVRALVRQLHRHGRGMRWLEERWPGSFPAPTAGELLTRPRMLARDRSLYGLLDVLGLYARDSGRLRGNR
jgi:glycosyltransferase involved in cell wall biosynthesis